jgi:hypothetical protein
MEIALTEAERQLLIELLEAEARQAPAEYHHTQNHEFKQLLREREAVVNGLLARLQSPAPEPAA